jgi:hypothetical protein
MPFVVHPNSITPPNDTVLWRYSDFAKFMDLIERRKLWFCRADKFEDPLEGTFTDAEIAHFRSLQPDGTPGHPVAQSFAEVSNMMRGTTFVNCWREGKHESMAMWDIYGKGSGVVAIKSTVGLLKEAVASYKWDVMISRVKYIDWNERSWGGNALEMCVRKDLSYAHESEVRAVIWGLGTQTGGSSLVTMPPDNDMTSIKFGEEVDVDPARLITEVVVGPREQSRIFNLVQVIMKRYGLPQPVKASDRLNPRVGPGLSDAG